MGEESKTPSLFRLVDPELSQLDFVNELPIDLDLNIFNYMYFYNGGGLATADFNNDGWMDLFFTSNLGREKLYLNRKNLQFEEVSEHTNIDAGPDAWTTGFGC